MSSKTLLDEIKALHEEANAKYNSDSYEDIDRVQEILKEMFMEEHTDWLIDQAELVETMKEEIRMLRTFKFEAVKVMNQRQLKEVISAFGEKS